MHQDARYEIVNYALRFIIRATSCTLRHRELRIEVNKRPQKADDHIKMTALFCITVKSAVRFSDVFLLCTVSQITIAPVDLTPDPLHARLTHLQQLSLMLWQHLHHTPDHTNDSYEYDDI